MEVKVGMTVYWSYLRWHGDVPMLVNGSGEVEHISCNSLSIMTRGELVGDAQHCHKFAWEVATTEEGARQLGRKEIEWTRDMHIRDIPLLEKLLAENGWFPLEAVEQKTA